MEVQNKMQNDMIEIDGSEGEGGGQILRTALTLSMITGHPFRISAIRARRNKPGLLRQHLTAVQAATEICGARVTGATPGSLQLEFIPGTIRGGNYQYAIGTAGSCTLVLQTILPALWFADIPSTVSVTGGTHNPAAPSADFLIRAWLPLLQRMGVTMDITLLRHGFYPTGGGELRAGITPTPDLRPLSLPAKGQIRSTRATAILAHVPHHVGQRELDQLASRLGDIEGQIRQLSAGEGPGNVVLVEIVCEHLTELFINFGAKSISAESVAEKVARQAAKYRNTPAAVGEYLADQLLIPMALAGQGHFTTSALSPHLRSNSTVIEQFLPVSIQLDDGTVQKRVTIHTR